MKGQYFSFDAIVAVVIFAMALFTLFSYWHSVRSFLEFQSADLTKKATEISINLFLPSDQPCSAANILSFGTEDRRLSWARISSCTLPQERLQELTKAQGNVCLEFRRLDADEVKVLGATSCAAATEGAREVAKIRRAVAYEEGALGFVDVYVYR